MQSSHVSPTPLIRQGKFGVNVHQIDLRCSYLFLFTIHIILWSNTLNAKVSIRCFCQFFWVFLCLSLLIVQNSTYPRCDSLIFAGVAKVESILGSNKNLGPMKNGTNASSMINIRSMNRENNNQIFLVKPLHGSLPSPLGYLLQFIVGSCNH